MKECTENERDLLDQLRRQFPGHSFVDRSTNGVYEKIKFLGPNFKLEITGHGGPEPEWVYKVPTVFAAAVERCLKEWSVKVEETRRMKEDL